ncbi:MAG: glycerophosphodiester phosphodiesterase [Ruminococcaceae bacterium]|nr:glycerophosphodiester phosphodiesterase [Oscillospiraceae bacterium]
MSKKKALICAAGGLIGAIGLGAYLIAPAKQDKEMKEPFMNRNYAHRGLHKINKSIPENSLPAFTAAARIGYGVELDVRLSADGEVIVFHDNTLERMCGVDAKVEDMTWEELRKLKLLDTEYGIPSLKEALKAMGKHAPVIVELKRGSKNRELCRKTLEIIEASGSTCCIESFDPRIVMWFRLHAPHMLRGQLSTTPKNLLEDTKKVQAFVLGNLLTNVLARPHFIAYEIIKKPFLVRACEAMGAMKVAWTALDWTNEENNDAVIFQFYRPRVKF